MSYLIDAHIFIWFMENNKKISPRIKTLLQNPSANVFISIASIWEMVIKQTKGQLKIPKDIEGGIESSGLLILPIEISHVMETGKLPLHHKDPFDRMLIAQALAENLTLVTTDPKIWQYNLPLIKA